MSKEIDAGLCFVLVPFEPQFMGLYEGVIKPTVEAAGLNCLYAGEILGPGVIMDDIWQFIDKARVIIADLTGRNPNVFYEVGYGHSLDKGKVILLTQEMGDVPFDLQGFRCIEYDLAPRGLELLRSKVAKTIHAVLARESQSPRVVTLRGHFLSKHRLDESIFSEATTIVLSGITLEQSLRSYMHVLSQRLVAGASLRLVVLDPADSLLEQVARKHWSHAEFWRARIQQSYEMARVLASVPDRRGHVKIGFLPYIPSFGLIIIDPESTHGWCRVKIYHHKTADPKPTFDLAMKDDPAWYGFFLNQFDILWKSCRVENIRVARMTDA